MSLNFRYMAASVCFLSVSNAACGSDVTDDPDSESGAASGTGAAGGSGASGSSGQGGSGGDGSSAGGSMSAGGAAVGCDKVPEYIDNLYQAASACSPEDDGPHCQDVVDGWCCPLLVESIQSPATQAYLDFLDLTRDQCPDMWKQCETVKCGEPPVGSCVPDGSSAGGHCTTPK